MNSRIQLHHWFSIAIGLLLISWGFGFFRRRPAESMSGDYLLLDLNVEHITELPDSKRKILSNYYNELLEHEKWTKLLPSLNFNPKWEVQPQPASGGVIIYFKVWNETHKAPVEVRFDPYQISENKWQVTAEGTKTYSIPIKDTQQLRAVIAAILQEVSPVQDKN